MTEAKHNLIDMASCDNYAAGESCLQQPEATRVCKKGGVEGTEWGGAATRRAATIKRTTSSPRSRAGTPARLAIFMMLSDCRFLQNSSMCRIRASPTRCGWLLHRYALVTTCCMPQRHPQQTAAWRWLMLCEARACRRFSTLLFDASALP